jgi:hypothetical protein
MLGGPSPKQICYPWEALLRQWRGSLSQCLANALFALDLHTWRGTSTLTQMTSIEATVEPVQKGQRTEAYNWGGVQTIVACCLKLIVVIAVFQSGEGECNKWSLSIHDNTQTGPS